MPSPDDVRARGPDGRDPHPDDDTLAVVALGEQVGAADATHVAACERCRAEVESLARVVRVGRSYGSDEATLMPPRSVWERIAAEVGIDAALLPPAVHPNGVATARASTAPVAQLSEYANRSAAPTVDSADTRGRRSRTGLLVAASVIGALLGVGATLGWQELDQGAPAVVASTPAPVSPDPLAAATLAPLPEKVGTGTAEVRSAGEGRELDLSLEAEAPPDAFLQVWLLSSDAARMVPLGVLEEGSGSFVLPPGVRLEDYPVVDVSIEPYDGDPLHSANSLVRGTLST